MKARTLFVFFSIILLSGNTCAEFQLPDIQIIQAEMDKLIDSTPDPTEREIKSTEKFVLKGIKYHDKGKYKQAIKYFNKAIKKRPLFGGAYYEKANTQYHLKLFPEAYTNVIRALVINPGMEAAHVLKAGLIDDSGDTEAAIIAWEKLISINPESFMGWLNKGITHIKINEFLPAEHAFKEAIALNDSHPSPYYFLFVSSALQNYHYDEMKYIDQYLAVAGDDHRRSIVEGRRKELTAKTVYLDPKAENEELELFEQTSRMLWFASLHRENYPSERGYKPSIKEEHYISEKLISYWHENKERLGENEFLAKLERISQNGFLDAYHFLELKNSMGEDDRQWGKQNSVLISEFESWRENQ